MKIFLPSIFFITISSSCFSQTYREVLSRLFYAQQQLHTISYTLKRSDTLVTGATRVMTGSVKIKVVPADSLFGFWYWAKKDGINTENIYDGHSAMQISHDKKSYETVIKASDIPHTTGNPGGQVLLQDLVKLDTTTATGFVLKENNDHYDLKISLPDITKYHVIDRYKKVTIDKKTMLPSAIRYHQETLEKVQDLYYEITSIKINAEAEVYDFSAERFPADYQSAISQAKKNYALKNKQLPVFIANSFDGKAVSSEQFKGKVILLDFWEVWCGPCLESMPKVQALYEKYKSKGIEIYGIVTEKDRLETAKKIVQKAKVNFPMLAANKKTGELFNIDGVPTYILVNRNGEIVFISEGFSDQLENEIKKII